MVMHAQLCCWSTGQQDHKFQYSTCNTIPSTSTPSSSTIITVIRYHWHHRWAAVAAAHVNNNNADIFEWVVCRHCHRCVVEWIHTYFLNHKSTKYEVRTTFQPVAAISNHQQQNSWRKWARNRVQLTVNSSQQQRFFVPCSWCVNISLFWNHKC